MVNQFKNKRAQLTIFVILAVIIIVSLAISLMYFKKTQPISPEEDMKGYVEKCISDGVKTSTTKLLANNGYMNLTNNYLVYYGLKVPYLCKATKFYTPCINQEPMYIGHLKDELEKDIQQKTQLCFSDLKLLLEQKGYSIDEGPMTVTLEIQQKGVVVNIDKKFNSRKETETKSYSSFRAVTLSPLYDLAIASERIVNFESTFCEFDSVGWMLSNPDSKVHRFVTSDGSKVYTVTDRISNSSIKFAVKTCVMPAGI